MDIRPTNDSSKPRYTHKSHFDLNGLNQNQQMLICTIVKAVSEWQLNKPLKPLPNDFRCTTLKMGDSDLVSSYPWLWGFLLGVLMEAFFKDNAKLVK